MKPNLYSIEGGVGKHLQFTALIDSLFKKYKKKLIINSGYPELFPHCPNVADSNILFNEVFFEMNHHYFKKFDNIFYHDPYKSDFLKGEVNVVKKWAELYEVNIDDCRPNFFINADREKILLSTIKNINKFILLQFTGGQGVQNNVYDKNNFGRNFKYGQELINLLRDAFPLHSLIIFGHPNEQQEHIGETKYNDQNGIPLFKTREDFMILSKYCDFFITIDSALQHMCSNQSFNKKGIVLWGSTLPNAFGYKTNVNLQSPYPSCVEIDPNVIIDEALKINI